MTSTGGYPAKRARTQRALVRGAMRLLAEPARQGLTVASVCKAAGVSNGTFYNHFEGVDDLLDTVAEELGAVVDLGAEQLSQLSGDPAGRVALGVLQVLDMPAADPTFAQAFVALMAGRASFRGRVRDLVAAEVEKGVTRDVFHTPSRDVATDALLGAILQTLRSMLLRESDGDRTAVVEVVLRLLGLPPGEIAAVTDRARTVHRRDRAA